MTTQGTGETDVQPQADAAVEAVAETTETTEAVVDWQARYTEKEVDYAKLQNDLNSLRGLRTTEASRDQRLQEISDRVEGFAQAQTALIKALATGETERLPEEVAEIHTIQEQTRAGRNYASQYRTMWDRLQASVLDGDGKPLLDLETAPEAEAVRQIWIEHNDSKGLTAAEKLAGFSQAIDVAHQIARKLERQRAAAENKKVRDEAKAATKAALDEAEVLDLNIGPGAGGGGNLSEQQFIEGYAAGELNSPAHHARAKKILANL